MQTKQIENSVATIEQQKELVVANNEQRQAALSICKEVKTRQKAVKDFFADSKQKTYAAWKAVVAQEKSFLDRLQAAEKRIKGAVVKYDQEIERKRVAEERRLQAEAEEKARKERERLEKEAAKLKTPELKEERLQQAQSIIPPKVTIPQETQKVDGESKRKIWRARVVDEKAVPREYLIVNQKAIDSIARSTKGSITIPGVEMYAEEIINIKT